MTLSRSEEPSSVTGRTGLCNGIPSWVSPELVAYTLATWQPLYEDRLTEADAVEILLTVGRLMDGTWENSR